MRIEQFEEGRNMKEIQNDHRRTDSFLPPRKQLIYLWTGLGFGLLYWIMEAIRDVISFNRGSFLERLIMPDLMTVWSRLMVVFLLILLGFFLQLILQLSRRNSWNIRHVGLYAGISFGVLYWILEAMRDALLFRAPGFLSSLMPDPRMAWIRLLGLLTVLLFSLYCQSLWDDKARNDAERHRQAEETMALMETAADIIFRTDEEGKIVQINSAANRLLGFSEDSLIGCSFLSLIHPDQRGDAERFYGEKESDTPSRYFEFRACSRDDRVVYLGQNFQWVRYEEQVVGYGVARNITQRVQAQEWMDEANRRIQKVDAFKSHFFNSVSHELRTPISVIREGVSLCLEGMMGPVSFDQRELLNKVSDHINRLTRLVNHLLDMSTIDSGNHKLYRKPVHLQDLIRRMSDFLGTQMQDKGIRLKTHYPPEPVWIYGDEKKIFQIFFHLVENAVNFSYDQSEVQIGIREGCEEIWGWVRDSGQGIDPDWLPRLFDMFQQFERRDGPGYRGTGLGLSIVRGFVEEHGGRVWVDSEPGKGTIVWFTLKKETFPVVLLVSRRPESMTRDLEEAHYSVIEADSMTAARRILQHRKIDLIVFEDESDIKSDEDNSFSGIPILNWGRVNPVSRREFTWAVEKRPACDSKDLRKAVFETLSTTYRG